MNDIYLSKYLRKKSLDTFGKPHKDLGNRKFDFFIVIPCYNEFDYLFDTLDSIDSQDQDLLSQSLVVIVINNSQEEAKSVIDNNQKTYDALISKNYKFTFIAIDSFTKDYAIPEKLAGVGYARKIGLDFSLNYIKDDKSVLCCLDADTLIDLDYLKIINQNFENGIDAGVINFKHQRSESAIIEEGIRKYELAIKTIAEKIDQTGSPYGYVSMGSTIACNAKSYVACGGMNTKKATEDFYFLQSLAKYTKIHKIKEQLVFPSSRNENRVYLGTGFRISEYVENNAFKNLEFSDQSYLEISKIIQIIDDGWHKHNEFIMLELNKVLDEKSLKFLINKDLEHILNQFRQNAKNKNQFILFFNQWFDALAVVQLLKTLNFKS
tara:strand:- start:278 stop:1414 length:1137 start_codon:yes stop_codon:yes gene_type:complete